MMKDYFRSGRQLLCITGGFCLAICIMTAMLATVTFGGSHDRRGGKQLAADHSVKTGNPTDSSVTEIIISEPPMCVFNDSDKLKKALNSMMREKGKKARKEQPAAETEETLSTTTTSAVVSESESTTITTTFSTQTTLAAESLHEEEEEGAADVSNGKKPFNYNDVSFIASDLNTLGDFADAIHPSQISWNTEEFESRGCVRITMESDHGSAAIDVKPLDNTAPGEGQTGSVSGSELSGWGWLQSNRAAGCSISSVVWKDAQFAIRPVREIGIGATLAQLTDHYLCVNGGANTLYKASDVVTDQTKLNSILAAENPYTFVGGRVYSIGSYLDKYYSGRERTFRFEDCDYVVQYGCNSIMEHNYTTGSWIIEYAVKEDEVIGISFMNKSYYKDDQKTAISTNLPSSGSESQASSARTETTALANLVTENEQEEQMTGTEGDLPATTETEEDHSEE